jgi:sarcosine oxidase subunit gamma
MLSRLTDRPTLVRVQSWDPHGSAPEGAARLLELAWPLQVGAVASGRAEVICMGPTEWLVLSDSNVFREAPLLPALEEQLRGSSFRATELSSALARIRIEGSTARTLLSKACALDVHSDALAPGRAPRTLVAGLPVIIRSLGGTSFECLVSLSYADYLQKWLADAALELDLEPSR